MNIIGWKTPEEIIDECSALFSHKIITSKQPVSLFSQLWMPRTRAGGQVTTMLAAKSDRLARTGLYMMVSNYNRLPVNLRLLNLKQLKKKLKKVQLKRKPP